MSVKVYTNVVIAILFFMRLSLHAQGRRADYLRADLIRGAMNSRIYYSPESFHWIGNENKCWYLQNTPGGKIFMVVNVDSLSQHPAFDRSLLAESLSSRSGRKTDADKLPFDDISFTNNDRVIEFEAYGEKWQYDLANQQCTKQGHAETGLPGNPRIQREEIPDKIIISPDRLKKAFIRYGNLFVQQVKGDTTPVQLSYDGSPGEYYSALYMQWSPDSRKLATYKIVPAEAHLVYLIESSPADQLQPKLHTRNYLKPGDRLPRFTPELFDITDKKQIPVSGLTLDQQYNLSLPVWRSNSQNFTFEYNRRGCQLYQVISVDAQSGIMKAVITESSNTFINYNNKRYRYDVSDGREIIWASERDGWNHLYLYDGITGKILNQITKGKWVVRNVIHVDEKKRTVLFTGSGMKEGEDPYLLHYYRINFDGSDLRDLTPENANHVGFFSSDFSFFADIYSRIDSPPTTVMRKSGDGKIIMNLQKADITSLQKTGWKIPEPFHAKGRDDSTDIWGIIVRPGNFDPKKKYPVIEYIYGGPHNSFVPKSFISPPASGDYRTWTALSELAELGFIVVQIDGMGTSNRSKAFHDVAWQNLKDGGFPDRIRWIKAAAKQYPCMDTSRVGIYGNSAGGQNAVAALLFHPEFYKVAVSSSGCHDNRMDKLSWNEQWMGYPVGPQYAASSNVTNAYRLKGKLLLILGEMDTNVPPESTLQLMNALIRANKTFDFLEVPGMDHSLGGDYGEHKRRDFFVTHLLGLKPPAWEGMAD